MTRREVPRIRYWQSRDARTIDLQSSSRSAFGSCTGSVLMERERDPSHLDAASSRLVAIVIELQVEIARIAREVATKHGGAGREEIADKRKRGNLLVAARRHVQVD